MEAKKFVRLTLSERVIIETLPGEKRSKSDIAKRLGRSRSTISNEVNKWVVDSQGVYRTELAHGCATTMNVSYETIYRYIYAHTQGALNQKMALSAHTSPLPFLGYYIIFTKKYYLWLVQGCQNYN